jgi:uncharacterized delta-60 repeat protein
MKNTFIVLIVVFTTLFGRVSGQATGSLDLTFNGTGKVVYDLNPWDLYNDVKVQTDGKIVAVGSSITAGYASTMIEVTRYNTDGSFDPSFGTNGHYNYSAYTECNAYKCLIKDDGKILIAGGATNYATYWMLLIQLNPDGTPDLTFGTNGISLFTMGPQENYLYALALQADGKILAAGYSQDDAYNDIPVVLRYSDTGVLDPSFGTNGVATIPVTQIDNAFSAVSVQSDGNIIAAGHISNGMSWFSLLIARFNTNGNLDPTYGTAGIVNLNLNNVDDEFFDMKLTPGDEAILTGFTVSQSDLNYHMLLMKFDYSGQPVNTFGTNGAVVSGGTLPYVVGDAMALQADGKILVTGSSGQLQPANNDWALWRFDADGTADNTFGANGLTTTDFFGNADEALGIALYQDKIIVAGKIRNATDYLDFAVAQYVNDFNVSVPMIASSETFSVSPNPVKRTGTVTLAYSLDKAENISIDLLNVTGSLVLSMSLGKQTAGGHSIQLMLPSNLSGGLYFIKLNGQHACQTSKILVSN